MREKDGDVAAPLAIQSSGAPKLGRFENGGSNAGILLGRKEREKVKRRLENHLLEAWKRDR